MTLSQLVQLNEDNFADFSNIVPEKHRQFNAELLEFISKLPKTKVLTLELIPGADRNYSIDTLLESNDIITGVYAMLECKIANNGFSVGDMVTAPTPYPADSGRTLAQGIGLQYNNQYNGTVKILVNDGVWVMKPYSVTTNASADPIDISSTISNWKLKVFVTYL